MADVADLCLIHAIGLIVIDEFQHMSLAKSGGEKKMINFLVTLVNVVEVSVVLIGTPKALRLFASEFQQARRASGDGSIVWDRFQRDESWEDFLDELWPYQWLKNIVDRDEILTKKLYDLSQGVPDIVVKLFCLAQARAILLEEEVLSAKLLDQVFDDEFSIVKPMLEALQSGNKQKIAECNDLIFPKFQSSMINSFDNIVSRPLKRRKSADMGETVDTDVANSAIQTIVSMGVAEDIAQPLVMDAVQKQPNLQLIQIVQLATTVLAQPIEEKMSRKNSINSPRHTDRKSWSQLPDNHLRKMHADKSGSMYEVLKEKNNIYPVASLLVS